MKEERKKILMAASNHWNSVFQVGSHHLAREFLKLGYEVAFLSDPISPLHLMTPNFKERFQIYQKGGMREGNLWTYVPMTLLPAHNCPLLRSKWIHHQWHNWTLPSVVNTVKQNGFAEVDILYLDSPLQSFWLQSIQARKTVYRMADQNAGFRTTTRAKIEMEKRLTQDVDLVVCTAKNLLDLVGKKAQYLPNGVPLTQFTSPRSLPPEYANIPKPIAIYVGAIEYWFDFDLIETLAKEMPQISFVLIGPTKRKESRLKNIYFLGPKSYTDVPSYLQHANVGLIPFDVTRYPELIHSVNPLKLYEYMASGLPVVARSWKELEEIGSPVYLSHSPEEFRMNILEALKKDGLRERAFANELDWSKRAHQLLQWL